MAEEKRTDRDLENRDSEMRDEAWVSSPSLPSPDPRPGIDHRYVRISMRGEPDNMNISQAMRDGWVPVKAADYPELKTLPDRNSQFPDGVEYGGLLLCKRPIEIGEKIQEQTSREVEGTLEAVDRSYFREENSSMPMMKPDRRTKIQFGDN